MEKVPSKQQGAPPPEAAKMETWLKGHLAHLTKEEERAFAEFKQLSTKGGLYRPASASGKASHDDATMIRYLRARRFVPQDAFNQFKDTEVWRKENELEALYEQIDIKDYMEARSVYPQWTGRRDKRGIPVYLYEVGKLDSKKMLAYTSSNSKAKQKGPSPSRLLKLFALYENLTRFVMPLCTAAPGRPNPETPVDQSNNIVDISRVGLKQFWNLRSHMQDASQLATAHYPETLDRIFILGAPPFFPTVWAWIKRWFDPITTSKIFVLSQPQILPTLTQFIDIESIPEKYGGQLKFECGDLPNLDPELRDYLTIAPGPESEKYFLTAPVRWLDSGEDGEMQAVGVGTVDGKQRKEPIATLHGVTQRVATHNERLSRATTRQSTSASLAPSAVSSSAARPVSIRQMSHHNQNPTSPLAMTQTPASEHPAVTTIVEPVTTNATDETMTKNGEAVAVNGNVSAPNGTISPPNKIKLPAPPTELVRQETVYKTPAQDPSELKTMT